MDPVYFNLILHAVDLTVFLGGFTVGAVSILLGIKLAAVTTIAEDI